METKKEITLSFFASVRLLTGGMTVHTFNIISLIEQLTDQIRAIALNLKF